MNIHRVISVYDKVKDNLIVEFDIDNLLLSDLKCILSKGENDRELNQVYLITNEQLVKLIKLIPKLSEFDPNIVEFYVECFKV